MQQLFSFAWLLLPVLSATLFAPAGVSAQNNQGKEWNNWYFTSGAITFNTDPPTVLDDSKMWSWENSATISDFYGNLLFYTNGDTIWNREHKVMGANSTTYRKRAFSCWAGSIILKQPGLNTLYYVFQAPSQEQQNHDTIALRYCVVDIDKNNGLGEIISKDNLILRFKAADAGREKLGIVKHKTKDAWWLVTTNEKYQFVSFLFNENGIDTNAVLTDNFYCYNGGYISFSPDNQLIGTPNGIFRFNTSTGKVEDLFGKLSQYPQHNAFSPNSRFFYYKSNGSDNLYQVDLYQTVPADKKLKEEIIYQPPNRERNNMYALMLAPDRKIYINSEKGRFLSVINEPDKGGTSCNLLRNKYELKNKNFAYKDGYGLPIIPSSLKVNNVKYLRKCNSLFLYLSDNGTDSVRWEIQNNTGSTFKINGDSVEYILRSKTNHIVKSILYKNGLADTVYNQIFIDTIYDVSCVFTKVELCGDSVVIGSRTENADKYEWSTGDTTKHKSVKDTGKYWVDSYINGCIIRDSFEVYKTPLANIDLPDSLTLCYRQPIYLHAKSGFKTYQWSNNVYDSVNYITTSGAYWLKVSNDCSDTTVYFYVKEDKCDCEIFIPNAFSPTVDTINDDFGAITECKFLSYNFKIYNRWGEEIFVSESLTDKWKGKFKGTDVPQDCYIYLLKAQKISGEWVYKNGFVNLIR